MSTESRNAGYREMAQYDRSYEALFNPGKASGYFKSAHQVDFYPQQTEFSAANAWWLAEFCRLTYRIDDQLRRHGRVSGDVLAVLDAVGFDILNIFSDAATSSLAVAYGNGQYVSGSTESVTLLVFCGSNEALDWKMNVQALQEPFADEARVHRGFLKCATGLASRLPLSELLAGRLWLAGHSLGAALATLSAVALDRRQVPIQACYSFGSPRIGNDRFVRMVSDLPVFRVVNNCDIVTAVPLSLGANVYLHPDDGIFINSEGGIKKGISDEEIQQYQLNYFPGLKKYTEPAMFLNRLKALPLELPRYLADHAIVNYAHRLVSQLAMETGLSP